MPISNSLSFYDRILSLFIYGAVTRPGNLIDQALIRPDGLQTAVSVSKSDYMEGPGRFALPSLFNAVRKFFEASASELGIAPGQAKAFNFEQLKSLLALSEADRKVRFNQANFDDGEDDYAYRVFFWSSSAFEIADGVQFFVNSDGTRSIENLTINPLGDGTGNDNFDWQGGGPAVFLNPFVRPLVDPFKLGGDGTAAMGITVTGAINPKLQSFLHRINLPSSPRSLSSSISCQPPNRGGLSVGSGDC